MIIATASSPLINPAAICHPRSRTHSGAPGGAGIASASADGTVEVSGPTEVRRAIPSWIGQAPSLVYASGRAGVASTVQSPEGQIPDGDNLDPLFDVLLLHIPAPKGDPGRRCRPWSPTSTRRRSSAGSR